MSTSSTLGHQASEAHLATVAASIPTLQCLNGQLETNIGQWDFCPGPDVQTRGQALMVTAQSTLEICAIIRDNNALMAGTMTTAQKQALSDSMAVVSALEKDLIEHVNDLSVLFRGVV